MVKKINKKQTIDESKFDQHLVVDNIVNILQSGMSNYAATVILDRAIPDARDGLKPVQRRILWQSHLSKLTPSSKHIKLSNLSGRTLAFHPHGSGSISEAAVNLSQQWVKKVPLIDIQGNNGSVDGVATPAADRYLEARQAKGASLLLDSIEKNAIDFKPNFDDTDKEPLVLPATYPHLLTNGAQGIAIAVATNILPHNPIELLTACEEIVKESIHTDEELAKIVKGPDFPTGGYIIGYEGIHDEIQTGKGKFIVRSKVNLVEDKNEPYLEIVELPYGKSIKKVVDSINKALDSFPASNIEQLIDLTESYDNISIRYIFKKGTKLEHMQKVEQYLYKKSDLETSISANNVMIINGKQKTVGLMEYLKHFIKFRIETLIRIWNFELNKLESRLEIIEGLIRLFEITDEIIKLAKESDGKSDLVDKLIENYNFTQRQAEYISSIPIYQLGRQDLMRIENEKNENLSRSEELKSYISDEDTRRIQILQDFHNSKQELIEYTRKTEILDEEEAEIDVEIKIEDMIEAKKTKVIVKKDLQIFQMGQRAYDNQIKSYKDNDIIAAFDALTTDYIIAITKSGKSVTRFINDLENLALNGKVDPLNKEIKDLLSDDEFVGAAIANQEEIDDNPQVIVITKQGYGKVIKSEKLLPNLKTKGYIKKLGRVSSMKKENDEVAIVLNFEKGKFDQYELHVTLKDESKKSGQVVRKVDLEKWIDRDDGQGGSGTRFFNTKNGELDFIDFKIIEKSKE